MSVHPSRASRGQAPLAVPLRVLRLDCGDRFRIRTVSPSYSGLLQHYNGKRGVYCHPATCDGPLHKLPTQWRGYAPIHVYIVAERHWLPIVLEITEALDSDMRTVWARGQEWELSRGQLTKKQKPAVRGQLIAEQCDTGPLVEFPILPTVRVMYHAVDLVLGRANPLPPREYVTAVEAPPPLSARATPAIDAEEQAAVRQRLAELTGRNGRTPATNGKHS